MSDDHMEEGKKLHAAIEMRLRPNGISLRIQRWHSDEGGVLVIPHVDHKPGDYAELIEHDGTPIPHEYNPNPDLTRWWIRCCREDGTLVWLMPFDVWRVFRDRAADLAMSGRK